MINQVIVGFSTTTTAYKKEKGLGKMSIPAFLDTRGLVARNFAENSFQAFIMNNFETLKNCTPFHLRTKFEEHKNILRKSFEQTGFGDLEKRMLTLTEAKKSEKELTSVRKRMMLQSTSDIQAARQLHNCLR